MSEINDHPSPDATPQPSAGRAKYKARPDQHHSKKRQTVRNNRKVLDDLGIQYIDRGDVLLMRFKNKPPADFYPATGRWRDRFGRVYEGGVRAFVRWYIGKKAAKEPVGGKSPR